MSIIDTGGLTLSQRDHCCSVWEFGYAGVSLSVNGKAMEPFEWGLLAIAALMVKKSLETTSDTITKELLKAGFAKLKSVAGQLPKPKLNALGTRVQQRFPAGKTPFDDPLLLAEIVAAEQDNPDMAAVVQDIQTQLPTLDIKFDHRKQQGIVINDKGTAHFHQAIEQTFN